LHEVFAAPPLRLAGVQVYQVEMEFWLPVRGFDAAHLDNLVTAYTFAAQPRPALASNRLNGMLKGYIDLVLEHDGRYYVADYKSNALGDAADAYTPQAMRGEVLAHRYDMQSALYVLALHRLLRSRLPDYAYAKHMGGSLTWFLRGHKAVSQGLLVQQLPQGLIDALDRAFAGLGTAGAVT
jgi:exodeoxyribonuclease V beta subunit